MLNLNEQLLQSVVDTALESAKDKPKWVAAINKAHKMLLENPYVEVVDDHTLLIAGSNGNTYTSNGVCQCTAFNHGNPCYHRAMARLYTRYLEAEKKAAEAMKAQKITLVQRLNLARAMREMNELFAD